MTILRLPTPGTTRAAALAEPAENVDICRCALTPKVLPIPMPATRPYHLRLALAALLALAGCGGGASGEDEALPAFEIRFEAVETPEVFQEEGPGRRSARDTSGLWAVVSGLSRPESAVVRNLENRRSVRVALFSGRPAGGATVELSPEAAEALGIGAAPVDVRVTAVRDEPQVAAPRRGFGLMRRLNPGD